MIRVLVSWTKKEFLTQLLKEFHKTFKSDITINPISAFLRSKDIIEEENEILIIET